MIYMQFVVDIIFGHPVSKVTHLTVSMSTFKHEYFLFFSPSVQRYGLQFRCFCEHILGHLVANSAVSCKKQTVKNASCFFIIQYFYCTQDSYNPMPIHPHIDTAQNYCTNTFTASISHEPPMKRKQDEW
jgi:hypothetical protein